MSKYRRDDTEPETLNQMISMMTKPSPLIEDPTTIACRLILKIYMEMKSSVLLGDKSPEKIQSAIMWARERTIKEVAHVKLRKNAVAKYDTMIERLTAGGEIEI
jgi:hypothetical protein